VRTVAEQDQVVFHGTPDEAEAMLAAVGRNCACESQPGTGQILRVCEAHRMVVENQRAVDGLVFARRNADRLKAEEHRLPEPPQEESSC
jgi:hypothetical protein